MMARRGINRTEVLVLQSRHPGGLLAAMADGSVRFVSEKTALEVLLRMAIRDDGRTRKGKAK